MNIHKTARFKMLCFGLLAALSSAACAHVDNESRDHLSVKALQKLNDANMALRPQTVRKAEKLYADGAIDVRDYVQILTDALILPLENKSTDPNRRNLFPFEKDRLLLMTTLVNLEKLEETSTMGRLLSEQIASRFTEHGFLLVEPKLMSGVKIVPETGEFMLSRHLQDISANHNVQAAIVGSYVRVADKLHINLKVVRLANNLTISSISSSLRMDEPIHLMLSENRKSHIMHSGLRRLDFPMKNIEVKQ